MFDYFLNYAGIFFTIFVINTLPAFAPPSWLILSIYKVDNPVQNVFIIALIGVAASVAGRTVMYFYSSKFRRFIPKRYLRNVDYFKKGSEKGKVWVFMASFLFSLSPMPSNFIFITSGISGIRLAPVLAGFALGRLLSYSVLVYASFRTFAFFHFLGVNTRLLADLVGLVASVLVIFIDWGKFAKKRKQKGKNKWKQKRSRAFSRI